MDTLTRKKSTSSLASSSPRSSQETPAKWSWKNPFRASAGTPKTQVLISNYEFSPSVLRIKVGDEVRWATQDSSASHVIRFANESGPASGSREVNAKRGYTRVFDHPGRFDYGCERYVFMTGSVLVGDDLELDLSEAEEQVASRTSESASSLEEKEAEERSKNNQSLNVTYMEYATKRLGTRERLSKAKEARHAGVAAVPAEAIAQIARRPEVECCVDSDDVSPSSMISPTFSATSEKSPTNEIHFGSFTDASSRLDAGVKVEDEEPVRKLTPISAGMRANGSYELLRFGEVLDNPNEGVVFEKDLAGRGPLNLPASVEEISVEPAAPIDEVVRKPAAERQRPADLPVDNSNLPMHHVAIAGATVAGFDSSSANSFLIERWMLDVADQSVIWGI